MTIKKEYLVWIHYSHPGATAEVFVTAPLYEAVRNNFDSILDQITSRTFQSEKGTGKGKRKGKDGDTGKPEEEPRAHQGKGHSKGWAAAMDTRYGSRNPFWPKFIKVVTWEDEEQVARALSEGTEASAAIQQAGETKEEAGKTER
jgi:hypothetical protein